MVKNVIKERRGPPLNLDPTTDDLPPTHGGADHQRRVYALPGELVERIVEFQKEKGYASEVEAVRRLLDEALKSRDNLERIINRYVGRLKSLRIGSEAAKEVLVGHPLVTALRFGKDSVDFDLVDGWTATISDSGEVDIWDRQRTRWFWIKKDYKDAFSPGSVQDEDIPF